MSNILSKSLKLSLSVIVALLLTGFFLHLIGVVSDNHLLLWLESGSNHLSSLFLGIFPDIELSGFSRVDVSALVALAFYLLLFFLLQSLSETFISDPRPLRFKHLAEN